MKIKVAFVSILILLTTAVSLTITQMSCNKNPCENVKCENGGTCSSGTCSCPTGYSGTSCQTAYSASFIGDYIGLYTDSTSTTPFADNFIIKADTGAYGITITDSVAAFSFNGVIYNDTIIIPSQTVTFTHFTAIVSGYGIANLPAITINYTENIGSTIVTVSFNGRTL